MEITLKLHCLLDHYLLNVLYRCTHFWQSGWKEWQANSHISTKSYHLFYFCKCAILSLFCCHQQAQPKNAQPHIFTQSHYDFALPIIYSYSTYIILLGMPSLPAKAIILNNTIQSDLQDTLPSMNKTYTRYNESLTNLSAARNREKVLMRRIQKEKKHYLKEKGHKKVSSVNRDINEIEKLIVSLNSMKEKREIEQKLEHNVRRRQEAKRSLVNVKERELAHKSSIYRLVEKIRAENEKSIQIERQKQLKLKEIVVMKERMKEKKRAYNVLQFYQTKMDILKKRKERGVEALMTQVSKNEQKVDKAIDLNVKLNLKHEKSANRVIRYDTALKKRAKSIVANPQ